MSPAEEAVLARSDRNAWLLVLPALVVLGLAAILPLLVMLVYSVLTPGEFGNVEWQFSWDGRTRFDPVWDMVLEWRAWKGETDGEPRLQRSVCRVERSPG